VGGGGGALQEVRHRHLTPAVVIGIGDDEAGQQKEEVHRQIAVVDDLPVRIAASVRLEHVERHHDQGGDPAQTVQNGVMGLCGGRGGRGRCGHGTRIIPNEGRSCERSHSAWQYVAARRFLMRKRAETDRPSPPVEQGFRMPGSEPGAQA